MRTLFVAVTFCFSLATLTGCSSSPSAELVKEEEAKQKVVREIRLRDAALAGSNGAVINTGPSVGDEHRRQQAERDKNLR